MVSRLSKLSVMISLLTVCASVNTGAQQPIPLPSAMSQITEDGLRFHLKVIASDETEGRDTPSTGTNIVSRYLATTAEHYGLKPVMPDGSWF